ncbi:MerR family DNA-binding protein [Ramlibacter sp. AN1133]|uniref:MerR family DNA-binding protein n=1 Tax=Ramlibacter sp. AN1133 TaxID=3133429 RepID=UPI0030BD3393
MNTMNAMNIGEAAAAADVTPKMVRHYESLGLIPAAERTEAGYRLYTAREVEMLRFVRQARALGFSIEQIQSLMALWRDEHRQSRSVKELARRQLADLEERQRELDAMRTTLAALVENCAGDERSCCPILERLSSPPAPVPAASARNATRSLKQVKPGSSVVQRRRQAPARSAQDLHGGHSGLMAWSRSFTPA